MANLDSNMIIYSKNAADKFDCGTISQLMTVILSIEEIENPSSTEITMKGYIQDEMNAAYKKYGSIRLGGIYKGETLTAENLMYAVTLQNANEAAYMLGDYFVKMMNVRAKELGANNTNFTNPMGLPDENSYTTAYDAYLLARHAMTLPFFDELIKATGKNGGPTNKQESLMWSTTNKFIQKGSDYYIPSFLILKIGDNPQNGKSSAIILGKKNGYSYMLSILNCYNEEENEKLANRMAVYEESINLFNWSFETFRVKTLLEQGKSFEEIPLKLCAGKDYLRLMSAHDFSALIPDEIEASSVKFNLKLPEYVNAPVKKGDLIGEAELILADKVLGKVAIISAEDAKASSLLIVVNNFSKLVSGFKFKFVICLIIVSIAAYVFYTIFKNRNRRRYSRRR